MAAVATLNIKHPFCVFFSPPLRPTVGGFFWYQGIIKVLKCWLPYVCPVCDVAFVRGKGGPGVVLLLGFITGPSHRNSPLIGQAGVWSVGGLKVQTVFSSVTFSFTLLSVFPPFLLRVYPLVLQVSPHSPAILSFGPCSLSLPPFLSPSPPLSLMPHAQARRPFSTLFHPESCVD